MSKITDINTDAIDDDSVVEAFEIVKDSLSPEPMINSGFEHKEIVITAAVTNLKIAHGLGFKPLDVIQTSLIGSGAVTWNYDKFTSTNLDITTTGACTVRAFVGAYRG